MFKLLLGTSIPRIAPLAQTKVIGDTARFQCHTQDATWNLKYKEWPNKAYISRITIGIDSYSFVIIDNVKQKDSGWYTCRGKDEKGEVFQSSSHLIVDGEPMYMQWEKK